MTGNDDLAAHVVVLEDGPFAGWQSWTGNPFEEHAGPYFWRNDEGEGTKGVFVPEAHHMNGISVAGGALVAFADSVVGALIFFAGIDQVALSVTLNTEFVGAGVLGLPVYGTGRVVRETRSMVFVQGQLDQEHQPILMFSSVARKITPRISVN